MEALPNRLTRGVLVLLALLASRPAHSQTDRRFDGELRPALLEASRKLNDARCRQILTDFTDSVGRRLDESLAATGQGLPGYLDAVVFSDGRATRPCANREILAWTTPGSRAVRVCADQFAALARARRGDAANILIHEALHTLGLSEGPPDGREITARVQSRCGR
jgi:hypothetical protein